MKISIKHAYYERLTASLSYWKREPTQQKVRAIMLDLLAQQRTAGLTGRNNAMGLPVVEMPKWLIAELFADVPSRTRFRKWVEDSGLVIKDRSWVSASIAAQAHQKPRPDTWHLTEDEATGHSIEVEYDTNFGIYGAYCKAILKVDGKAISTNDSHVFAGSKAIDDYKAGEIGWGDFAKVAELANNLLTDINGGRKQKGVSCRTYDAVALCKKNLRARYLVDSRTGRGMEEIFDINAAATFNAKLGATALGFTDFCDVDVKGWAWSLVQETDTDKYEVYFQKLLSYFPHHDLYNSERKWNEDVRECLKTDIQVILNCGWDYISSCQKAFRKTVRIENKSEYFSKRRQWCLWTVLHKADHNLWELSMRIKLNEVQQRNSLLKSLHDGTLTEQQYRAELEGTKNGFFRLHTLGEKMVMDFIVDIFVRNGVRVHRVHDAIWTADARLLKLGKDKIKKMVGRMVLDAFNSPFAVKQMTGINKLRNHVGADALTWAKDALVLDDSGTTALHNIDKWMKVKAA